jgi:Zn-dependent protease with chaperone function
MDFFRSQDIARRNTVRLVILFALALISLVAITNLLLLFGLGAFAETIDEPIFQQVDWHLYAYVSVAVIAIVGFGCLYKIISLSGGGARVAEMMQGRLIVQGGSDLDEQRILNVVEEMAIASGTPVPPVYLLEEEGINAFAAGYSPADAVIGITRGAIQSLSRDELQGVIAHEFSHILHGDMRLNIRLIGILYGIMVLGMMGYYLLRSSALSRRSKNGGNIAVVGIGLMVIGFAGTFFGNLIKAAVSRQREFLADASAVQYTRNPDGIADALKRIGGSKAGSVLENPGAAEISHALFGNGVRFSINSLFATHPPLEKRISAIQPNWDGSFDIKEKVEQPEPTKDASAKGTAKGALSGLTALAMTDALISQAGIPQEANLTRAKQLLATIPSALLKAAHNPFSARALIYLLLLDDDETLARQQLETMQERADPAVYDALLKLFEAHLEVSQELRLPLVNLALPTLRQLSAEQYAVFRENLTLLVLSDGRTSLWEWVLQRVVLHQLDAVFLPNNRFHHQAHHSLKHLAPECAIVLGFVVRAGHQEGLTDQEVFAKAMAQLELPEAPMPDKEAFSIDSINNALEALQGLRPLKKPAFLKACAVAIAADGVAHALELELFRAIAATLDCPLPPIPLPEETE